jgi:hypothetical protein
LQSGSVRRGARLLVSNEIEIPAATGPFCPAVLIPSKLLGAMSDSDLEHIGLHEAAHLARRDDYALFAQRVIEALFALHPVIRYLTRQIELEREIACDDIVAASAKDARSYADCLTRTVALCGGVRTLAAANVADGRSHLSRRIELLVDRRRRKGPAQLLRWRAAVIAITMISAAGLLARTPLLIAFAVPRIANPAFAPVPTDAPAPRRSLFVAQAAPTASAQARRPASPETAQPVGAIYVLAPNDLLSARVVEEAVLNRIYAI